MRNFCIAAVDAGPDCTEEVKHLFQRMPPACGIAFVVLQQPDGAHDEPGAMLSGLGSQLPVSIAKQHIALAPNHVYIVPKDQQATIADGILSLRSAAVRAPGHTARRSVDRFWQALAEDQGEKAIAIVLADDGQGGSLGLQAIVDEGGLVMGRQKISAQRGQEPDNTLVPGGVDYSLAVSAMPAALLEHAARIARGGQVQDPSPQEFDAQALAPVLALLQQRYSFSFAGYRTQTLSRRIHRRMLLRRIDTLDDYTDLIRADHGELRALLKDFLVGVTEFFRDAAAWRQLENEVIGPMLANSADDDEIRAWVPAVSTGQEAYTLAILLFEAVQAAGKHSRIRVFASDANDDALAVARTGIYPSVIASQMDAHRLQRYFDPLNGGRYRVSRNLRELVIFSRQDLFADPPYRRMDIISCRNLLIYLEPKAQHKLIELFHASLRPGGYLMLGTSESTKQARSLFHAISKQWKIYQRIDVDIPPSLGRHYISRLASAGAGAPNAFETDRYIIPGRFGPAAALASGSAAIKELEAEFGITGDGPPDLIERLESLNDELDTRNQEVVSANLELQAVNEELQAAKQELQLLNEELSNANQKLHDKIGELQAAIWDLNNLIVSSDVATLCLDRNGCIKWFSPTLGETFNIHNRDAGRPVDQLAVLAQADLMGDTKTVMKKMRRIVREIQATDGRWFLRRVSPYRAGDCVDGVIIIYTDITEGKRSAEARARERELLLASLEQRVLERTHQLRALTFKLTQSEEAERQAIARDLHDGLGQTLAIAKIKLSALHRMASDAVAQQGLADIEKLIDQSNYTIRSLAAQLCPAVLYDIGLVPALKWLADEMRNEYGLHCRVTEDDQPKSLDQSVRIILFRAVRELLINVVKHADISSAEVRISVVARKNREATTLKLTVRDNGKGFDPDVIASYQNSGLGLLSVRERLMHIGGSVNIESAPGAGTVVTLITPLQ